MRRGHYTLGYSGEALDLMSQRSAASEAAFFLPYLADGMVILDCGCGDGTLTLSLLDIRRLYVVGIDIEPAVVRLARAKTSGLRDWRGADFAAADLEQLPFPDGIFDAVFGHTVLMHVPNRQAALHEIVRVLKPGGFIGFREPDFDGDLYFPVDGPLGVFWNLFAGALTLNGGDPSVGSKLRSEFLSHGLAVIDSRAVYVNFAVDDLRSLQRQLARLSTIAPFIGQCIEENLAPATVREWLGRELEKDSEGAFLARSYCEITARKKEGVQ